MDLGFNLVWFYFFYFFCKHFTGSHYSGDTTFMSKKHDKRHEVVLKKIFTCTNCSIEKKKLLIFINFCFIIYIYIHTRVKLKIQISIRKRSFQPLKINFDYRKINFKHQKIFFNQYQLDGPGFE